MSSFFHHSTFPFGNNFQCPFGYKVLNKVLIFIFGFFIDKLMYPNELRQMVKQMLSIKTKQKYGYDIAFLILEKINHD